MPTTALASRVLRAPGKSRDVLLGEGERARSTSLKVAAGGLRGFLDLDLLRLGFGRLRNPDLEDTVRHRRFDFRRVDAGRKLNPTNENTVAAFRHVIVLVLVALLGLDLLLAANRQQVVVDRYLDVLALKARQLGTDLDFIIGLGHVDRRNQIRLRRHSSQGAKTATREVVEQAINFAVQRSEHADRLQPATTAAVSRRSE